MILLTGEIMPIIFRPHRSTLNEAMIEAKVFNTKEEMFNYIVSRWKGSFDINDLVIDDKENADNRTGWLDTHYVCTKRFGNKINDEPQCIGMCATKFPHTSKCPHYKKNDSICFKCNNVAYNFDSELDCNTSGVINGEIPLKSGADNKDGFKDKLTEIISSYFSIGDSYTYELTRVKEGFGAGTISIDDFVEWNEDSVCDLVDFILQRLFK